MVNRVDNRNVVDDLSKCILEMRRESPIVKFDVTELIVAGDANDALMKADMGLRSVPQSTGSYYLMKNVSRYDELVKLLAIEKHREKVSAQTRRIQKQRQQVLGLLKASEQNVSVLSNRLAELDREFISITTNKEI